MNPEKVLPPGVNGKITGYLMVKVDEIFWARNSPGEVVVQLQWWGEKYSTLFRPEDITLNEPKKNSDTSVIYNIRTSPGLFESYLRNCGRITFTVLRGQNKNVILGSAVIKELEQILSLKNYHSYFSIFSPKGHRIGDLHVSFELTFKQARTRTADKKPNEESSKVKPVNIDKTTYSDQLSSNKCKSGSSEEEKIFANILQKGHALRKAMVLSVLADCPIDHLDSVVNCDPDLNFMKQRNHEEEVKLVDFLLGKHMSAEEEVKALKTLRCISPADNFIDIAKVDLEAPKVIKSKCCLHGQDCREENNVDIDRKDRKSEPVSLKTNSTSGDLVQTRESRLLIDDETKQKKKEEIKFNCYRITVSSLKLTLDGNRKVFYVPGHNHNPPGTYFILEVTLPSKGEFSSRSIKFLTKKLKGQCVDFDQGSTHRLCGAVTWPRVCSLVNGSVFTISWRHLNQRVPCPLGSTKLEKLNPETGASSVYLCLPIYSNTRLLTGHLSVTISLGMIENLKEGIFHIVKSTEENFDDLDNDNFSSKVNTKMLNEPVVSSFHHPSPAAANSDEGFPITTLDEEILNTIDLLNSKTDDIVNKNHIIEKHEACVQTTLPFTQSDCHCHCQKPVKDDTFEDKIEKNHSVEENSVKLVEDRNQLKTTNCGSGFEKFSKINRHFLRRPNHLYEDYSKKEEFMNKGGIPSKKEEIVGIPLDFEKTKIHDFTVKIEKVVGIPLFTGDNDMDCYVDYSFPKVDRSGKMVFDEVTNGTDIQMALRETEFRTCNQHKFRLNCKLNKALMTLPVHEITFTVWGRYYRPRPRDYMLGKASLPLMRLSNLELIYCQQRKREAIFEKVILPITIVESSVTYGYKGSFGDLHVILGYSCASATSYKEWREIGKEYFSSHQILDKNEDNCVYSFHDRNIPLMNFDFNKGEENRKNYQFTDKLKPDFVQASRINTRNRILNSPDLFQSNFHDRNASSNCNFKTQTETMEREQLRTAKEFEENVAVDGTSHARDLNLKFNVDSDVAELHDLKHDNSKIPSENETNLGNLVEHVLWDMRERQADNSGIPKKSVHTIVSNQQTVPKVTDPIASGDAFELFDLKVDLPSREESMDFEARSQYSFLCSPPHIPHFSDQHVNVMLESDSTFSMKGTTPKPVNPFSSISNMSFSINSESSIFKVPEDNNMPYQTNNGVSFEKKVLPINELTTGERNSLLSDKKHDILNINDDNTRMYGSNKSVQRNTSSSFNSERDNVGSSDATLKSLESLKSFKEEFGGRESKDIGVETEFNTQNKDTQTSYKEEQFFKVKVQICRALGLPSVEVRQQNGKIAMVKPTSYAYFSAMIDGKPRILKTKVVEKKSNPIWNESWNVDLPVDFLKKCDRELEVFVDLNGGTEEPSRGSDCSSHWPIILRTGVDLTPITAGLEHASGWFSLSDRSLFSRAQLKVVVTPLEDVSPFRDDWLREYTKAKGKKMEINVPHSSSIATSLQEKLKELENLTERMKNKMSDRPNWNRSPPLDLLSEIKAVTLSQDPTNLRSSESWSGTAQRVETATSPIVVDLTESNNCSPVTENNKCSIINLEDEDEDKSVIQTYTVDVESGSSNHDSLETPSETIDRILSKMRNKR